VLREAAVALRDSDLYRHRSACLGELAHCHALLGEVRQAEAALAEADESRVPALVMDHSFVEGARAQLAYARGEHSHARQLALACAEACDEHGHVTLAAFAWHDLARLGDPGRAAGRLASLANGAEGVLLAAFAGHAAALAARDAAALDRAAATFEQLGATLYAADAAAAAATRFREMGLTGSALTSAASAHRLLQACAGAHTPAVAALDASLPLTDREREIATLAALGKTNRQIAVELVVSVRTIDNHLHRVFSKLGVTQRQQLAAILLPRPQSGS
jgi:DNA-binding NarL/FixJ family response regulator